jgi:hypothetical protein
MLLPGKEATPSLSSGRPSALPEEYRTLAKGEILIFLGDFAVSTAETSFVVMRLYDKNLLTIQRVGSGISISADIWDDDGKIFATIENNRFRVNSNKTIPLIRPDPHTLMVEDERKARVLTVRFLNPSTIKIGGIFRAGGKYPVIVDEDIITFGPLQIKEGFALHVRGQSIFEWPGQVLHSKTYLKPEDSIPNNAGICRFDNSNGTFNLTLKNSSGDEYSVLQLGGLNVPDGTVTSARAVFRLRNIIGD